MIRYVAQSDLAMIQEHDRHVSGDELARSIDAQRVLILLDQGEFTGWLRFSLFWDEIPFLNMLYLLEGHRGKGHGTRLLRRWEGDMARLGYKQVLTSTLSSEGAQFFYRKNGYMDCGSLLLPGEPLEIILRKELA